MDSKFDPYLWIKDEKLTYLQEIISKIRLLSVDVFDTLLFRACREPNDIFEETGRRAQSRGVLCRGITPHEFKAVRIAAMDSAYRNSKTEPYLEDIYSSIPEHFGERNKILDIELEAEADACYLNPSIVSLMLTCKSLGIKIALLSDTYLGRQRVINLLRNAGFPVDLVEQVMVSVDERCMKATGLLFRKLLANNKDMSPQEILHIGDNIKSDVESANHEGLQTCHYDVIPFDSTGVMDYEATRHGDLLPGLCSLRKLAMVLDAELPTDERGWFKFGAGILGPFMSAFCDWVIDSALAEKAEIITPFMREATILTPLIRKAISDRGIDIPVLPLFVSREAVVLAGQERVDKNFVRSFFENREYFRVNDLFRSLDLSDHIGQFFPFADIYLGEAWGVETENGKTLFDELQRFLLDTKIVQRIEETIQHRRHLLTKYLEQTFNNSKCVATVDLGFLGQIQKAIDSVRKRGGRRYRLIHLMAFGKDNFGELLSSGVEIRGFAGSAGQHLDLINTIHRSAPIIEQMLMGREGSTVGYSKLSDSSIEPVLERNPISECEHQSKHIVQQGINQFQKLWLLFCLQKPDTVKKSIIDRKGWCQLVHRLIDMPTPEEARLIGDLHNDCNFGSSKVVKICSNEEEKKIQRMGGFHYYHLMRYKSKAVWPQGAITRVEPGTILSLFSLHMESGYFEKMHKFSESILSDGIREIVLYGAGKIGRNLIRASRLLGIKVLCAVDRNEKLWGSKIEGVEVVSLDEAVECGNHCYAVASLAFIDEIQKTILTRYDGYGEHPQIFLPV